MNQKRYTVSIVILISILLCQSISIIPLSAVYTQETPCQSPSFFDQKIMLLMKLARFPGLSACVINDDEIIWEHSYGYYDQDKKKEPTKDTIYVIASITKTIVGTALMQLYENGMFDLDQDVNTVLPFSLRNPHFPDIPITFRMLLSHTSSLNTNTRNEYYWMNYSEDPPFPFFPEPYLEEFLIPGGRYYHDHVWSETYPPGEQAMYANIGFDIISYLVELLSGEPFLEYCDQHIFTPLEMANTSFNLSQLPIEQVAIPYQSFLLRYYQLDQLPFLYGDFIPSQPYWKMRAYPAGGLYTTIEDLSHFLIAHMNDGIYKDTQLLKKDTVDLMHTIHPDNDIGYGLAWMQYPLTSDTIATGHGGDLMGCDTYMLYNKDHDIGIIYFANGNPYYSYANIMGSLAVHMLIQLFFEQGGLPTQLIHDSTLDYSSIIKMKKAVWFPEISQL